MEYLVTGSAKVEPARCTTLRALDHVDYRTLNVNIDAQRVNERGMRRDILLHEGEHEEHGGCREAEDDEHNAAHSDVLRLVEARHECDDEASEAGQRQHSHINVLIDYIEIEFNLRRRMSQLQLKGVWAKYKRDGWMTYQGSDHRPFRSRERGRRTRR